MPISRMVFKAQNSSSKFFPPRMSLTMATLS